MSESISGNARELFSVFGKKNKEPLNVQVGDEMVYTRYSYGYSSVAVRTTVKRITKTGMIRLEDDSLWTSEGESRGDGKGYGLHPITEEEKEHFRRQHILKTVSNFKMSELTTDQLERIQAIMNEGAGE